MKRVETGPVQFPDDWPGVFIRGDNALAYAMYLNMLLEQVGEENLSLSYGCLRGLVNVLNSCQVGSEPLVCDQVQRKS